MDQDRRTSAADAHGQSRRGFLKTTGAVLAGTALSGLGLPRAHAQADDTIEVALVGCGGRGTGAVVNALNTKSGPTRLVAMADVFEDRLQSSLGNLKGAFGDRADVPPDRQFVGFEGYKSAIDSLGENGVVILATPPAFRPIHVEYAVEVGRNVFMEKAFAVDGPGIRRILAAGERAAEKNLKVAGGLMSRHYGRLEEAVGRIHDGEIGTVITCWAYRMHGPVGFTPKQPGETELAHQIRNYSNYTWLNGSFMLDWLIHNLDICCWVKDAWPLSCRAQGGRQVRTQQDQLFDHMAAEFTFPDGTRLFAQGRHMDNCWGFFGDIIHGATGSAVLGEGVPNPRIFTGHSQAPDTIVWQHEGGAASPYDVEHELLFQAIRDDEPYNEAERCAYGALVGILGRMAMESGKEVTWEEAMASELVLAPGLDEMTEDSAPPVAPDEAGDYPVAMPGFTEAL